MNKVFTVRALVEDAKADGAVVAMSNLMPALKAHLRGNDWVYLLQGMTIEAIEGQEHTNHAGETREYVCKEAWTEDESTAVILSRDEVFQYLDKVTDDLMDLVRQEARDAGQDLDEYIQRKQFDYMLSRLGGGAARA